MHRSKHGLCQERAGGREKAAMEERLEKMQQEVGNPDPDPIPDPDPDPGILN